MLTDPLVAAIAEAEQLIANAPQARTETERLEGYRYLAGGILATLHAAWATDRSRPGFIQGTGPYTKMGLDNPDTLYFGARIDGAHSYVVTGRRGSTCDLSFQVLAGNYTDAEVPGSVTAFDDRAFDIDPDGGFELRFGPEPAGDRRNYIQLAPDSTQLLVREVYSDWDQQRGTVRIDRTDAAGAAPAPLTLEQAQRRFERAGAGLTSRIRTWLQFPEWFYLKLPVNTMTEPRHTPGGLATQFSSAGHYDLTDDQALIITVPAADVPYQGFQLGSVWYTSLNYTDHQTSLNSAQAQVDPDGKIRIVVSERNPGITNWLETIGHPHGYLQFRWQRVDRELTAADGPQVELVAFDDVPSRLPFHERNRISPQDYRARIAARQAGIADRMLTL
ncbi:hypothetical protein [Skermania piniformis]|uniref:DUF1214 domain-containing protein n=1 Tax=Skermania pinensis TaxID=39122 RepID=A0ABX8SB92_9ACTN|nr:hypothetical protein [Skermania piniformis]QXQ14726.1 hypothetical protein KV203_04820 [Skermania piniformis]